MADVGGTPTISQKSRDVQRHFVDLTSLMDDNHRDVGISASDVTDAFERFTLWAGNLGALRAPSTKMSLDSRLSEAEDIRHHICQQLDELVEVTADLTDIVQGTTPNRNLSFEHESILHEDTVDDGVGSAKCLYDAPLNEAQMMIQVISECITALFRLGMLVRKSTHRDRFKRALQATDNTFPSMFDVDYVRHKHPKIREDWLVSRLGGGIAKRRQFIKYCRDHRTRLGIDDGDNVVAAGTGTERLSSKATTFLPVQSMEQEDDIVSFVSASSMGESLAGLTLPRLFDLSKNNEPFECPICFTLQTFQTEKSWRIHAFRDLKAYVCTVGEAECADEIFGDRDSWFEHELKEHRARYKCSLCQQGPLVSKDIRRHIQAAHGPFPDDQLQMLQEAGREPVTKFRAQDCPFCNDWSKTLSQRVNPHSDRGPLGDGTLDTPVSASRFKRHVATHQEQLAIFALPRTVEEDDGPGPEPVAFSVSKSSSEASLNPIRERELFERRELLERFTSRIDMSGFDTVAPPPDRALVPPQLLYGARVGSASSSAYGTEDSDENRQKPLVRTRSALDEEPTSQRRSAVFDNPGFPLLVRKQPEVLGEEEEESSVPPEEQRRSWSPRLPEYSGGLTRVSQGAIDYGHDGYEFTRPSYLARHDSDYPRDVARSEKSPQPTVTADVGARPRERETNYGAEIVLGKPVDHIPSSYTGRGRTREDEAGMIDEYSLLRSPYEDLQSRARDAIFDEYSPLRSPYRDLQSPSRVRPDQPERFPRPPTRVRNVSPAANQVKGILKIPTSEFSEDPAPIREGVAPRLPPRQGDVPAGARWTKINRSLVNPEALTIGKERFEVRDDFVIVLRVLSKEEIQAYATATAQLRERKRLDYELGKSDVLGGSSAIRAGSVVDESTSPSPSGATASIGDTLTEEDTLAGGGTPPLTGHSGDTSRRYDVLRHDQWGYP